MNIAPLQLCFGVELVKFLSCLLPSVMAAVRSGAICLWKKSGFPEFILKLMPALLQTDGFLKDNNNAAQRLLDGMNFMAQSVSELSLGPTKAVTSWLTDQIAPAYWRPNSQILVSSSCLLPYYREKLCIAKIFSLSFCILYIPNTTCFTAPSPCLTVLEKLNCFQLFPFLT